MRDNTTKILEEAYKQVIKENRISQMQPEEIMSLDPATLNNLTITVGELARLSDEQLQALKAVAYKQVREVNSAQSELLKTIQSLVAQGQYEEVQPHIDEYLRARPDVTPEEFVDYLEDFKSNRGFGSDLNAYRNRYLANKGAGSVNTRRFTV